MLRSIKEAEKLRTTIVNSAILNDVDQNNLDLFKDSSFMVQFYNALAAVTEDNKRIDVFLLKKISWILAIFSYMFIDGRKKEQNDS